MTGPCFDAIGKTCSSSWAAFDSVGARWRQSSPGSAIGLQSPKHGSRQPRRQSSNDAEGADLALDLDCLSLEERDARDLAQRFANSLSRRRDVEGLYRVLQTSDHLAPADRHRIGTEIIQAIAEIVPDLERITPAIDVGVRFVEDHRQSNRLADAHRLAGFVRQNLHRTDDETRTLAELVVGDVDRALKNTAIEQRVADELDRESLNARAKCGDGKAVSLRGRPASRLV